MVSDNEVKGNCNKYHFTTNTDETHQIFIGNYLIGSSGCKKLLGVKTDSKLTFDDLVKNMQEG